MNKKVIKMNRLTTHIPRKSIHKIYQTHKNTITLLTIQIKIS